MSDFPLLPAPGSPVRKWSFVIGSQLDRGTEHQKRMHTQVDLIDRGTRARLMKSLGWLPEREFAPERRICL